MRTNQTTRARERWPVGTKIKFGTIYATVEHIWKGNDGEMWASIVYMDTKHFTVREDSLEAWHG